MKRKNINQINQDFPRRFPNTCGSESLIFYLENVVYKEFLVDTPKDILKRKEQKILALEQKSNLQQYYPSILCLVDSLLEEYIRGYIMNPVFGKAISRNDLAYELKAKALESLRNILASFRNEGFLYLDIRQPNIKIDEKENPILLDIDSILQIDNPQIDCVPADLKIYMANGGKINTNAQIFMFNIFSQEVLHLTKYGVDATGAKILDELSSYTPDSVGDHEYLCDHIKKR